MHKLNYRAAKKLKSNRFWLSIAFIALRIECIFHHSVAFFYYQIDIKK